MSPQAAPNLKLRNDKGRTTSRAALAWLFPCTTEQIQSGPISLKEGSGP